MIEQEEIDGAVAMRIEQLQQRLDQERTLVER